jgi:hypothetical protein
LSWHIANKGFTKTKARFNVHFVFVVVGWISGVDYISIFSRDDGLDKNSHKDLMESHSNLLDSQKGSFVKLTSPNSFDSLPGLIELVLRNSEHQELFLDVLMVLIRLNKLDALHKFFASI